MVDVNKALEELKKEFDLTYLQDKLLTFEHSNELKVDYIKENNKLIIYYTREIDIFKLLFELQKHSFAKDFSFKLVKKFDDLSLMVDVARNNVLKVATFKKLIRHLAVLGYDTLKIYLEDLFEVIDEPYFGYLRGRYSKKEIKEIVDYASIFGIEVVPCIQTLAHLRTLKKWCVYAPHFDIDDILLVGDERVYTLIDNMMKSAKSYFNTNRINIGMDEAHHLGSGRYLALHGFEKRIDIFSTHLKRVLEIAQKYDFKCEMWGDMLFNQANLNYLKEKLGKSLDIIKFIYWDYEARDIAEYQKIFNEQKDLLPQLTVAGGVSKWFGFAPNNLVAFTNIKSLMAASLENGIKEFTLTAWGDNGGETSIFASLPAINYASNFNYHLCKMKESFLFKELTGMKFDKFMSVDLINCGDYIHRVNEKNVFGKIYLFNDPLLGFYDSTVNINQADIYQMVSKKLRANRKNKKWGYLFNNLYLLADLLSLKVDLGVNLRKIYLSHDFDKLKEMKEVIKILIKKLDAFYEAFYYQWHLESKGNGFDVQDQRIGGLKQRLLTTVRLIDDYLNKRIEHIEELEENILDFYGQFDNFFKPKDLCEYSYQKISSINVND